MGGWALSLAGVTVAPLSSESDMARSHRVALGMDKNTNESVCMCLCV